MQSLLINVLELSTEVRILLKKVLQLFPHGLLLTSGIHHAFGMIGNAIGASIGLGSTACLVTLEAL